MEANELLQSLYRVIQLEHKLLKAWKDGLDPKDFLEEFSLLETLLHDLSQDSFYQMENAKHFDIN